MENKNKVGFSFVSSLRANKDSVKKYEQKYLSKKYEQKMFEKYKYLYEYIYVEESSKTKHTHFYIDCDEYNNDDFPNFVNDLIKLSHKLESKIAIFGYVSDTNIYEKICGLFNENSNEIVYCVEDFSNKNIKKQVSFHIIFYEIIVDYKQLIRATNDFQFISDYEYLNKYTDKSVYTNNQKLRIPASNKEDSSSNWQTIETAINIPSDLYLLQYAQNVNNASKIVNCDLFLVPCTSLNSVLVPVQNISRQDNKKKVKKQNKNNNIIMEDNDNNNIDFAQTEEYSMLDCLLGDLCTFTGHDNVLNEIRKYIPNNEYKSYGKNNFRLYYTTKYNQHKHNTKDNLETMFNDKKCRGLCYVLSSIHNNVSKLPKDKKQEKMLVFNNLYRYYLYNYDFQNTSANYDKIVKIKNNILATSLTHGNIKISNIYLQMYGRKILTRYHGNYILALDNVCRINYKSSDEELKSMMKSLLNGSFSKKYINTLYDREIYEKANLSYLKQKEYETEYTDKDFEKFEKIMFEDSFVEKYKGEFARELLYYDVKNSFRKGYNVVKFYYGTGANLKTSEAKLYKNIINNMGAVMDSDYKNYQKEQKRNILSSLYVCIEEIPKIQKEFNNLIDEIKKNSESDYTNMRGMGENDKMVKIDVRHQLNTNNKPIFYKYISKMEKADFRRFLVAERIEPKNCSWAGKLSRDSPFCKDYARYILKRLNNNYVFKYDICDEKSLVELNTNSVLYTRTNDDIKDTMFAYIQSCFQLCSLDKEGKQKIYVVDKVHALEDYNYNNVRLENRRKIALSDFVSEMLAKFMHNTKKYYVNGQYKRTTNKNTYHYYITEEEYNNIYKEDD